MRFVRLEDIPFWFPEWAQADQELMNRSIELLQQLQNHQQWMAQHFGLDDPGVPFAEKKHKTSFMRRFAPDGVATGILATFNVRTLRHIIAMRTALGAEEEIRLVFDEVARICLERFPDLMADYSADENREWIPEFVKV
jgi:thymidylate synthase (FAD)